MEINNAIGIAGGLIGWDVLELSGELTISATAANPFVIDLQTLNLEQNADLAANFNPQQNYSWDFVTADGGITGFDPTVFTVNASNFLNDFQGGSFSVVHSGNSLAISFSAVPEPSSLLMVACGLGLLLPRRRRVGMEQ
jgi:hypothetical protein